MSVQRLDRGTLRKPKRLANGWVRMDGHLTRTGVFEYRNADGSIRRELRTPEEVFHADSLESFQQLPVTDEHPPEFLTSENAHAYTRGSVGESVRRDGDFVAGSLMVIDGVLAKKVDKGEAVEISCGYTTDLEERPGVTANGEKYDCIQRNIRGNHVAIVPKGRAGPEARLRLDKAGAEMVQNTDAAERGTTQQEPPRSSLMADKNIRIDGVQYPGTEQVEQAIEKLVAKKDELIESLKAELKAAKSEAEKASGRADEFKAQVEKKDAELKEAPKKLKAQLAARGALESQARQVLGAKFKVDALTDREIREAVIEKVSGKEVPEAKSDEYVEARFDAVMESADAAQDDEEQGRSTLARGRAAAHADDDDPDDYDDAEEDRADEDLEAGAEEDEDEPVRTNGRRGDSISAYDKMLRDASKAYLKPRAS